MIVKAEDGNAGHRGMAGFVEDWVTIWQSEMSALATDREALDLVAQGAASLAHWHDARPAGGAGPDAPPGAAPAGDASDVAALRRRVAELERMLALRA